MVDVAADVGREHGVHVLNPERRKHVQESAVPVESLRLDGGGWRRPRWGPRGVLFVFHGVRFSLLFLAPLCALFFPAFLGRCFAPLCALFFPAFLGRCFVGVFVSFVLALALF